MKNVGKRMPEAEIKKTEALHLKVQAVMKLSSNCRDQDPDEDRPLTWHIVSVARSPDVAEGRSVTEQCGRRFRVETCIAQKAPLEYKR
jgi:hypothetical protein